MKFLPIRSAAARPDCPVREGTLRAMTKRGEVPGFYSGTRFWVDFDGLLTTLTERSRNELRPQKTAQ